MNDSADLKRRLLASGIGLLPLMPLLSACGGGQTEGASDAPSAEGVAASGDLETLNAASAPRPFIHPGMLHTEADFNRVRLKVHAGAQPWQGAWQALLGSEFSRPTVDPRAQPIVIRGAAGENIGTMVYDLERAYQNALHYKVSNDTGCADYVVKILNAWGSTLKQISNAAVEVFLVAGIQGYQWANVAEIMRGYPGWAAADQQRFKDMLLNVFYPLSSAFLKDKATTGDPSYVFASWDLLSMCSIMSIGILCDRRDLYDEALSYFRDGRGNGSSMHSVYAVHPGYLGQFMESGRDQGHATLAIGLYGVLCETAWNQGDDLYGHLNNRFLMAAEYVARSNLSDGSGQPYALPFTPQPNPWAGGGLYTSVSAAGRPALRTCWESIYNHYVNRKGLSAPNVAAMVARIRPEAPGRGGDDLGSGTLMFAREQFSGSVVPTGLSALIVGGGVQLSWWGCFDATGYAVQRAASANGPFVTIASVNEPRSFTDHPIPGVWYYRVTANRPSGVSGASNVVRIAAPGELRLALPMNAGSGMSLADTVGGRNATLKGGASWANGRSGAPAIALDGKTGYIELPTDLPAELGDFTLAVWVYWDRYQTDTALFVLGQDDMSYMLMRPAAAAGGNLFVMSRTSWRGEQGLRGPTLPAGRWVHMALTLSASRAQMYYDGVQVAQATDWRMQPFQIGATKKNLLGTDGGHAPFAGKMQDFRIYNRALDAAAVATLAK